jgi:hypothetical protein
MYVKNKERYLEVEKGERETKSGVRRDVDQDPTALDWNPKFSH